MGKKEWELRVHLSFPSPVCVNSAINLPSRHHYLVGVRGPGDVLWYYSVQVGVKYDFSAHVLLHRVRTYYYVVGSGTVVMKEDLSFSLELDS